MPVRLKIHAAYPQRLGSPLRKILRLLKITCGEWSITLVRDPEMTALHARTMGQNTTTDVLTFDLRDQPTHHSSLITHHSIDLDTVICLDEARRRAKELGHAVNHELLLYALHSLLHVQGYDDLTPAQFKKMHAREDELLTRIGIGALFSKLKTQNSKLKSMAPNLKSQISNLKLKPSVRPPSLCDSVVKYAASHAKPSQNRISKIKNQKSAHHSSLITHHSKRRAP